MAKKLTKKKIFITIVGSILFLCLLSWFVVIAYVEVNKHSSNDYKEGQITKYIAHRGLSSEYYQNTYQAFFWASMSNFFSGVECDVWRTKDGVWVCCHDDNPFADDTILVSESNFADIESLPLDTEDKGEFVEITGDIYITKFEKYLSVMQYSRKTAYVELKYEYSQENVKELMDFIKSNISIYKITFCSFNKKVIEKVLIENENVDVMLFSNSEINSYLYAKMGYNLGLNKTLLNEHPSRIELLHENKSVINVYTVNTVEEADKYEDMGVDYITTDYDFDGDYFN